MRNNRAHDGGLRSRNEAVSTVLHFKNQAPKPVNTGSVPYGLIHVAFCRLILRDPAVVNLLRCDHEPLEAIFKRREDAQRASESAAAAEAKRKLDQAREELLEKATSESSRKKRRYEPGSLPPFGQLVNTQADPFQDRRNAYL